MLEFEDWYKIKSARSKEGDSWLEYKAKHLLSGTNISFEETREIISITIEQLLEKVKSINPITIDSFCFIIMRNLITNKYFNYRKKISCEEDFTEYEIANSEYDIDKDKQTEENLKLLNSRAETKEDKLVLMTLLSGGFIKDTGINSKKAVNIVRKLKGMEEKKYKYKQVRKSRAKSETEKGRPNEYQGIARLKDDKIEKVYQDIKSVKIDEFTPELVRRCLKGELKQHKGYIWKLVSNL